SCVGLSRGPLRSSASSAVRTLFFHRRGRRGSQSNATAKLARWPARACQACSRRISRYPFYHLAHPILGGRKTRRTICRRGAFRISNCFLRKNGKVVGKPAFCWPKRPRSPAGVQEARCAILGTRVAP